MKRRERSPGQTVEQKGRFTVVTEDVPDSDPKRSRPDHDDQQPTQQQIAPAAPPQQLPPQAAQQPPRQAAQQPPQAPPGLQPQRPGGGVEQQEAADQDRPPPEPPPRDAPESAPKRDASPRCSDPAPPITGRGAGGRREGRGRLGEYENQTRNRYGHLFSLLFLLEGFDLDAILTIQEFKGIGTAIERILAQELLTTVEDMKMSSSFPLQPFVEALPEFLHPNIYVRWNVVSHSVVTTTASDPCLTEVIAIFAADFDSNIGIQDSCCPHFVEFKHLAKSMHCIEEIGSLLLMDIDGDFSMSWNSLQSLQLAIPEKCNFLIHAAEKEFKGMGTAIERILVQVLLTIAEDMKTTNSSFTFQPCFEAFLEFLHPNIGVKWNVVSRNVVTTTASDPCLTKVIAIFAADFDSNIGIQGYSCPRLVEFKHLPKSLHCVEEIGSFLLMGIGGGFSMSGNSLQSLQLAIPEKCNFLIHAAAKFQAGNLFEDIKLMKQNHDSDYPHLELDCGTLPSQKLLLIQCSFYIFQLSFNHVLLQQLCTPSSIKCSTTSL